MGWLDNARALRKKANRLKGAERAKFIDEQAGRLGINARTLNGQISAANYVDSQLTRYQLKEEDIRASVLAIGALRRLERRAPATAADLRIDILKGRIKDRAVEKLAKKELTKRRPWKRANFDFVFNIVDQLPTSPNFVALGPIGEVLQLDAEYVDEFGRRVAVIITSAVRSERAMPDFQSYAARVFAALTLYEKVIFVASETELDACADLVGRSYRKHRKLPEQLILMDLYGVRSWMKREQEDDAYEHPEV